MLDINNGKAPIDRAFGIVEAMVEVLIPALLPTTALVVDNVFAVVEVDNNE